MTDLEQQPETGVIARPAEIVPANSPDKWKPASVQARLKARLKLSEALNLVAEMLDSFPGTDVVDPDHYNGALAGALVQYPRETAVACADIRDGVVTECLFRQALTSGRVHDWCRHHSAQLYEFMRVHEASVETANKLGPHEVNRSGRETIDELRARLGPTFGLKRAARLTGLGGREDDDVSEKEARRRCAERAQRALAASMQAIETDYARRGLAPVCMGGTWNLPVSPALAAQLGKLPAKAESRKARKRTS